MTGDGKFRFNCHVWSNGTILRIGSPYSLDFCSSSVFICTCISRNKVEVFKFKFLLCSLVENKVEGIDVGVSVTVKDEKHVLHHSDVVGTKARSLVDRIICEGWERVLHCQVKNTGNIPYMLDLRKSSLAC